MDIEKQYLEPKEKEYILEYTREVVEPLEIVYGKELAEKELLELIEKELENEMENI